MTTSHRLLLPAAGHCVPMPLLSVRVAPRPRSVSAVSSVAGTVRRVLAAGVGGLEVAAGGEEAVGDALAQHPDGADDLFVTAIVPPSALGHEPTRTAFGDAGRGLRRPVVDLVLLETPLGAEVVGGPHRAGAETRREWVESWRTLLALRDEGRIRTVGTREADRAGLALLMDSTGEAPAVNQVEVNPYRPRRELRAFHAQHGIATRAQRPTAAGRGLVHDPVVARVALAAEASPGQVLLAWQWHHGDAAVIGVDGRRLVEQAASVDLRLTAGQVAELDTLAGGGVAVRRRRRLLWSGK